MPRRRYRGVPRVVASSALRWTGPLLLGARCSVFKVPAPGFRLLALAPSAWLHYCINC